MSKPASPFTLAVRDLLNANSGITHADARTLLAKKGFTLAPEPNRISAELSQLQESYDIKSLDDLLAAAKKQKFGDDVVKRLKVEFVERDAFRKERQSFDAIKWQWGQNTSKSVSRQPSTTGRRRGRPARSQQSKEFEGFETEMAGVAYVKELGGFEAAKARRDELNAEVAKVNAAIECYESVQSLVEDAA